VQGKPYLAADNVEKNFTGGIVVNPSYLAPYAYRMFATVDPGHDWNGLVDTSYSVLKQSIDLPLDKKKSVDLPPDWVEVSRTDGSVHPPARSGPQGSLDTNYGFDALRVPWRLYLDWQWYHDARAYTLLSGMKYLQSFWEHAGLLNETYAHDGSVVPPSGESPAMYGGTIGTMMIMNPSDAKAMYDHKLIALYTPDYDAWVQPLSYYDDNWAWFGIALYNGLLPNLWATVTG
ncbi:MAG: hypothetical protein KGI66_02890, partial [Patescibacteria group bacterium]|nr:hypothetical protein [Patescibacteria group bacterium]